MLSVSSLIVTAQTANESPMTTQEYYASQAYLISQYCDGKISYSQFQEQSQSITDNYVNNNTIGGVVNGGVLNASNTVSALSQKVGATVQKYGEFAKDKVSSWIYDFMDDYSVLSDTSTTDLKGHGALLICEYLFQDRYASAEYYYCDYIVINNSKNTYCCKMNNFNNGSDIYRLQNGNLNFYMSAYTYETSFDYSKYNYYFYGDVRYDDGTQAPTNDEYIQVKDYDFTQVPENDLEKLLEKILNELELQQPDLSTIEGLLSAIYYRLGTLDSDNDNELLSQVITAINSLNTFEGGSSDNSDIISLLDDIKKSLVFEDGENIDTFSEQLKIIIDNQITADDFVIDEDMYNNNREILKLRLLGKFSFIEDLKTFVIRIFDSYKNTSDNPNIEFEIFGNFYSVNFDYYNEHLPLIRCIIAAFIYISYALHTYRKVPSYINGGDNE